jgi:uncharacterized protein (TIGR03067 family)
MKIRIAVALFAVALLVAADAPDEAVKKEQEKFKGTWIVESFQVGDKTLDKLKGMTYRFDGDKVFIKVPDGKEIEGTYKLDPSKNPKELDIITPRSDGGKVVSPAIYAFDGEELKICSGATTTTTDAKGKVVGKTGDRPTKFEAKTAGLIVLKREKK